MTLLRRALASLALLSSAPLATGEDCRSFACKHGSTCAEGDADYGLVATFPYLSKNFLGDKQYDGQHCVCTDYYGYSGVSCKRKVEICSEDDAFACFHGSECVDLGGTSTGAKWGCDCSTAKWGGSKELFAGLHCEFRASDVCATQDEDGLEEGRWFCANGGKCQDQNTEVMKKCKCPDDWFGPHCEYQRSSEKAWSDYQPQKCSLNCRNGGKCVFGLKDYGAHDSKNDASATFTNETHSDGMHCVCPDGYTGLICQIPAKKCGQRLWCYNGAECAETQLDDGTSKKYCDCAPAATNSKSFAGLACQHQSGVFCNPDDGNRKDMSFCVNGGTCWEDGEQHLGCDCKGDWSGQHCEFHKQLDPKETTTPEQCKMECQNGGKCAKGVKDYGKMEKLDLTFEDHENFEHCTCPEGWTGLDCAVKVEFCNPNSRQVCFYGSTCEPTGEISANGKNEYKCTCKDGKTPKGMSVAGRYCEHYATDVCTDNTLTDWHSFCTNGGTCVDSNVPKDESHKGCFCLDGWGGEFCERKANNGNQDNSNTQRSDTSSKGPWTVGTAALGALVTMAL